MEELQKEISALREKLDEAYRFVAQKEKQVLLDFVVMARHKSKSGNAKFISDVIDGKVRILISVDDKVLFEDSMDLNPNGTDSENINAFCRKRLVDIISKQLITDGE